MPGQLDVSLRQRAEQAGIIAQPGGGYLQTLQIGSIHDMPAHRIFNRVKQERAAEGYTPPRMTMEGLNICRKSAVACPINSPARTKACFANSSPP